MGKRAIRCARCGKKVAPKNRHVVEATGKTYGPSCIKEVEPDASKTIHRTIPTRGTLNGDEW